ncbi:hypothetical protein AX14_007856 [Amanita brunnescens Koide BX004]|nr:hypothetical protein AX14_007856 [Amanita brunnescens Koide BX004]
MDSPTLLQLAMCTPSPIVETLLYHQCTAATHAIAYALLRPSNIAVTPTNLDHCTPICCNPSAISRCTTACPTILSSCVLLQHPCHSALFPMPLQLCTFAGKLLESWHLRNTLSK